MPLSQREKVKALFKILFLDDSGKPYELTEGQAEIAELIVFKKHPRNIIMCHTRYGKSDVIAMSVLIRSSMFVEKWAIVSGTKEKAKIIMNYIIKHIFDNELMKYKFVRDKKEDDELRRYRNKSHLTFRIPKKGFGEIYIASAKEAIGLGAPNVIQDESSLIDDEDNAMSLRMLGDSSDNFLVKIGNPFRRNHFLKSYEDPHFHKIDINCYQGLQEGRIPNLEYLEEQKRASQKLFRVLFENKFPEETDLDDEGWMNLFTEKELSDAQENIPEESFAIPRIGNDVGGGGDSSAWVIRWANKATILREDKNPDTMNTAGANIFYLKELKIPDFNLYVDGTGIGKGVVDRLHEQKIMCTNVISGKKAGSKDFLNKRAECYWRLRNWVKEGGKLSKDERWNELLDIKFKVKSDRTIQIMGKDDMRAKGIKSPNVADALALTFATHDQAYKYIEQKPSIEAKELEEYRKTKQIFSTN